MTACYGRPDLQVVQCAGWSKAVFDVNQASLGPMREIWPGHNNCTLQCSVETLIRSRVHRSILRSTICVHARAHSSRLARERGIQAATLLHMARMRGHGHVRHSEEMPGHDCGNLKTVEVLLLYL